jgi:hypothetical protein
VEAGAIVGGGEEPRAKTGATEGGGGQRRARPQAEAGATVGGGGRPVGTTEGEGAVGRRRERGDFPQECACAGRILNFAAAAAATVGAGRGSPSPFCASGVGWGS